jgi:hypothetical protein
VRARRRRPCRELPAGAPGGANDPDRGAPAFLVRINTR